MKHNRRKKNSRRISDAELLSADLTTDDANTIPNIVREKLPDTVRITDVIRKYHHARYPAEKIFCCVCGARQHQVGFHVKRSDNIETTLGNCCASKPDQLGKEYVAAALRSREERTRQGYLHTIHAFQPEALRIAHAQMLHPWKELAHAIRTVRYELRETLGAAWDVLRQSAITGSALTAPERVLVSKWTGTGVHDDEDEGGKDRFAWVENGIGGLPGPALFRDGDPVALITDLENVLRNFRVICDDTDSHTTSELRQLVKMLRAGSEGLALLLAMRRAAEEFFQYENLTFIAGWIRMNHSIHGHNFRHLISAREFALTNETMARSARKPRSAEPPGDLIRMLAVA